MLTNKNFSTTAAYPFWLFILLPSTAMLLGWGLRGFIGGGPFGAMIPGAMVTIVICMLLKIPASVTAVITVFGTAGIGMGGEMTYGQTLGFLRNPDTIWWGTCGTTVKGGVWGFVGGIFIGLGLIHKNLKVKTIATGMLLFLIGLIIGLKFINDPKLIYFSDPVNKPRQESWAGLLVGGIALLIWLRTKLPQDDFKKVMRFAKNGLVGGALGFGLGAFWLVLGTLVIKNSWISDWWKLMEFSFGFILGGFLGYAAWRRRKEVLFDEKADAYRFSAVSFLPQFIIMLMSGLLIYLLIPLLSPFADAVATEGYPVTILRTIARVFVNYCFIGSLLIMLALRWPFAAFQLAVTLTFTHTVIDLVDDWGSKNIVSLSPLVMGGIVLLCTTFVSWLVYSCQQKQSVLRSMFFTLTWSTVAVAIIRMAVYGQFIPRPGISLLQFVIGGQMVFNIFLISAIIVTILASRFFKRV